jgi:phenylpropionate dioxygenase-like ring-hydroxylating dioxygenase large terminal subunit
MTGVVGDTWRDEALDRLAEIRRRLDEGFVPSYLYNDPLLFELEKERLFRKAWVFLAHETELREPGDFVVRSIVDDSVLVIRSDDGVQAFLNFCRHRGSRLCQAEVGRAKTFTCIYHGWSYDREGKLIGVPYDNAIYGGVDRSTLGLVPVRVETCEGFVFGCLDDDAPPLDEYLGEFRWYLELVTRRSEAGLEVVGVPQRWIVEADWKIASENLIGDSYHTPFSHRSTFEVGLLPFAPSDAKPGGSKTGLHIRAGRADVAMIYRRPGTYMGYPLEFLETLRSRIGDDQRKLIDEGPHGDGVFLNRWHLFPNLSCLNVAAVNGDRLDPYCSIRLWQPRGAGVMEIYSWLLVEADAAAAFKDASRRAYILSFGPSGMLEQDDMENWRTISRTAVGTDSRVVPQYARMGEDLGIEPIPDWPGPGTAYPTQFFDLPTITFLKRWATWLGGEERP